MAFRMAKYMLKIKSRHLKKNPHSKTLPLVIPLIFYTGTQIYNASLDLWGLYANPMLAKSIFTDSYPIVELQKKIDKDLQEKTWAGSMSFLMKHIKEDEIAPYLECIKIRLKEIAKVNYLYIEPFFRYTLSEAESKQKQNVIDLFKEIVNEEDQNKIMSIAEQLRQEGVQEGIQLIASKNVA